MDIQITTNASDIAARLSLFPALMQARLFDAMGKSLDSSQNEAVNYNYATFMQPSGELEGAYYQVIEATGDGVQGQLINPVAWAWRQEEGFSGMTDSLGRYFPHTPEYHYMQHTLDTETPVVGQYFTDAVGLVISGIGG